MNMKSRDWGCDELNKWLFLVFNGLDGLCYMLLAISHVRKQFSGFTLDLLV